MLALLVLGLFGLVQVGSVAHLALVAHEACEVHQDLCHAADPPREQAGYGAHGDEERDSMLPPGEGDHLCAWSGVFRERCDAPGVPSSVVAAAELDELLPRGAPQAVPRHREALYLLAPKGSPPADRC